MEAAAAAALKSRERPALMAGSEDDAAWDMERGGGFFLLGGAVDEFSIDDLLDFDGDDGDGEEPEEEETAAASVSEMEYSSSDLSFEPPPPPSEIGLPAIDEELEWVSRIMDDSFSDMPPSSGYLPPPSTSGGGGTWREIAEKPPTFADDFCRMSPEEDDLLVPVKAKRSKRGRAAGWVRRRPFSGYSSSPSSSSPSCSSSSSITSSSSCLIYYDFFPSAAQSPAGDGFLLGSGESSPPPLTEKPPPAPLPAAAPKKRGRKPKNAVAAVTTSSGGGERSCSHCGTQRTPQWRAGPMGAKTLCNACGVRFKSGRLLPEYRPACSPTFVSRVHSNSHRRVLEMRRKKEVEQHRRISGAVAGAAPPPAVACL